MFKQNTRFIAVISLLLLVFATPVIAQENTPTASLLVGQRAVDILSAPNEAADVLGFAQNKVLRITGISANGLFYQVDFDGEVGWISQFVAADIEGDVANLMIIDVETTATDDSNDESSTTLPILTVKRRGSIREAPNSDAATIGEVQSGEQYTITAISPDERYYQIQSDDIEGWLSTIYVDEIEGDLSTISETETQPCFVRTDEVRTVQVRVGYGINRGVSTFLTADTDFEVQGQNMDGDDGIWYALLKEEAAPGKSIEGDVAWVAADDVEASGDCEAVPVIDATGIIPLPPLAAPETSDSEVETVETPDEASGPKTVIVSANAGWVDTGLFLMGGQSFSISATGRANIWPACWSACAENEFCNPEFYCAGATSHGPGGFATTPLEDAQPDVASRFPMPSGRFGALVGRIDGSGAFQIGTGGTFTASADGNLFLIHNDFLSAESIADNLGAFTVTVTVQE
ncbi:SH3 domain-containing protein [Candidatus Leptofilum sp.]|uniref:SH3 domain-containing protein n=1 Tax=Candidatus Leptofilum sp. TaxID=3241576 RepID=UPI003B5B0FE4